MITLLINENVFVTSEDALVFNRATSKLAVCHTHGPSNPIHVSSVTVFGSHTGPVVVNGVGLR